MISSFQLFLAEAQFEPPRLLWSRQEGSVPLPLGRVDEHGREGHREEDGMRRTVQERRTKTKKNCLNTENPDFWMAKNYSSTEKFCLCVSP